MVEVNLVTIIVAVQEVSIMVVTRGTTTVLLAVEYILMMVDTRMEKILVEEVTDDTVNILYETV